MLSRLKPDSATTVGVLTAAGVYLIYNNALPPVVDIRNAQPDNSDVEVARRHSAYVSVALIGAVFLVAKDLNSYIISGAALVGIDLMFKHANGVNPQTGKLASVSSSTEDMNATVYPLADYDETEDTGS